MRRAVHAGLEITRDVARLSEQAQRKFGVGIDVRVGVHRGPVYLDTAQDDVYGLAANLAARVSGLAPPGRSWFPMPWKRWFATSSSLRPVTPPP